MCACLYVTWFIECPSCVYLYVTLFIEWPSYVCVFVCNLIYWMTLMCVFVYNLIYWMTLMCVFVCNLIYWMTLMCVFVCNLIYWMTLMCVFVCNHNVAKVTPHNMIIVRASLLQCSDLKKKAIYNPTFKWMQILWDLYLPNPSSTDKMWQGQFLNGVQLVWIQFSFETDFLTKT